MDDKVLQSVVEITEQTNTTSLGYCVISTLAEMIPMQSASLYHNVDSTPHLVARLVSTETKSGRKIHSWEYGHNTIRRAENNTNNVSSVTKRINQHQYQCEFTIEINTSTSTTLTLELSESPSKYELLIDGLLKIYKNYLVLLHESERDKLTGLFNRRTMEERLRLCFSVHDHIEDGTPGVAVVDLDNFKLVNDSYGHLIGDEILLLFAQQMQAYFSDGEQLFRFGGEEFVIIFPPEPEKAMLSKLNSFREHISNFDFPQVGSLTFSAGICTIGKHDFLHNVLDHADKALYYAKGSGRNQVKSYEYLYAAGAISEEDDGDSSVELF